MEEASKMGNEIPIVVKQERNMREDFIGIIMAALKNVKIMGILGEPISVYLQQGNRGGTSTQTI